MPVVAATKRPSRTRVGCSELFDLRLGDLELLCLPDAGHLGVRQLRLELLEGFLGDDVGLFEAVESLLQIDQFDPLSPLRFRGEI